MLKEKETINGSGHKYNAADIVVLEGLEPVRKRPGMYIGTTGSDGLHHLVWEIFDNARDEAMGGFCNNIEIVMLPGNMIRVADNGRGIPVDLHKKTKVSALETVMTTLHAGGKFGGEGYKISSGLHGVGASVVNALSSYLKAEIHRDGGCYIQEYSKGIKKYAVKKIKSSKLNGTIITFEPDQEIFQDKETKKDLYFDWTKIIGHLRQQAYLVKNLKISIIDAREIDPLFIFNGKKSSIENVFYFKELELETPSMTFYFEGGIVSLIRYTNKLQKPIHDNIFYVQKEVDNIVVEVALQYVDDIIDRIIPFANNIYTSGGGTHVTGFKMALTRIINTYCKKNQMLKESEGVFTGEDVLEGLTAIISVKLREIQFEGQTKSKLGSTDAQGAVAAVFSEAFSAFLEEKPEDAKAIIKKSILALQARKAAKAAKDSILRKGALEGMTLPGKLADCQSKKAEDSELFLVEGDSAGGCFSGDTKIALADGRNISIKDLIKEHNMGKINYCYTIMKSGDIGIQKILNPRRTKTNTKVIKVILDNGEEIICTPDHLFMLKNGTYKMCKDITVNDSLMPLYKKISKKEGRITIEGYEMIYNQKGSIWVFTHNLKKVLSEKSKKQWSNPILLNWRKAKTRDQWTNDFRVKRKIAYNKTYYENTIRFLKYVYDKNNAILDEKLFDKIRKELNNKNILSFKTFTNRFFNNDVNKLTETLINYNHKIKAIIPILKKMDVYDIEVPETHNFALSTGIFVHNSAKQGRDRRTQAILPLKGKILNVERARIDKMLASKEIKSLVIALGTSIGDMFDIEKIRYHKIIIATDADVDGSHIRTLLLTLLYRYFKTIIEAGYVYIAQPPLYKIKKGKEISYAYSDDEKEKIVGKDIDLELYKENEENGEIAEENAEEEQEQIETKKGMGNENKKDKKENDKKEVRGRVHIQRYKGLGEMNPEELWETTMDPKNRILKVVTIQDAEETNKIFDILMGSEVPPRKSFIQTNARLAEIDV